MEKITTHLLDQADTAEEAVTKIYHDLSKKKFFSEEKVVLVLSGGSNISVAQKLVAKLPKELSLTNLSVLLADERYGEADSLQTNEEQLRQAGVIRDLSDRGATFIPMLNNQLTTGEETATAANEVYKEVMAKANKIIFLAGIGDDGHTAGMLPTDSAEKFSQQFATPNLVVYHELPKDHPNPHKKRLTMSMAALALATTVYAYAVGENKRTAISNITEKNVPLHQVPALALHLAQEPLQLLTDQQ